jgi:hypothetical protein
MDVLAYQAPEGLNARDHLLGGRVAVDVPRVGIPRDHLAVVNASLAEKLAHPLSARIVVLDRQKAAALDPAGFRTRIP